MRSGKKSAATKRKLSTAKNKNGSTVTKITLQTNSNRASVFLDGRFAFGLSLVALSKLDIKKGNFYTPTQLQSIITTVYREKFTNKALRLLALRPRSVGEMSDRLYQYVYKLKLELPKKIIGDLINQVTVKLVKQGLLDDRQFAGWWLEQRLLLKPSGKRRLAAELRQKKVSDTIIKSVLAAFTDSQSEKSMIKKILAKKLAVTENLPYLKRKKRLLDFLFRRGFDYQTSRLLVDRMLKKS